MKHSLVHTLYYIFAYSNSLFSATGGPDHFLKNKLYFGLMVKGEVFLQ